MNDQPESEATVGRSVTHANAAEQLGYTMIPNAVLLNTELSVPARMLFGILKYFAWQGVDCYPGQRRLADILCVTDRSIRSYIAELVDAGLVESDRRGMGQSNLYTVCFLTERNSISALSGSEIPVKSGNQLPTNSTQEEKKTQSKTSLGSGNGSTLPLDGSIYSSLDRERLERHLESPLSDEDREQALQQLRELRSEAGL